MIPLSNGRSPRIDQFYATLRTLKSHQASHLHSQSQEDESIEHIRSLGKEILSQASTHRSKVQLDETIGAFMRSESSVPKNLYDKYKGVTGGRMERRIEGQREKVRKEQVQRTLGNVVKNKKYEHVGSKIVEERRPVDKLNYVKKIDREVQKLKEIEAQGKAKQIKNRQHQRQYYSKKSQANNPNFINFITAGVVRRTQQLKERKARDIQKIRAHQIKKQSASHTFKPVLVSKTNKPITDSFQKRLQTADMHKTSRQNILIKQLVQSHSFSPQTNKYRNAQSKIEKLWKQNSSKKIINSTISKMERVQSSENELKSLETANSTTRINIKSINELSFIFQ